jgi:hypothetical protein
MGCLPELAPPGQNHLLRTATEIRDIMYSKEKISYRSLRTASELLKLAARPKGDSHRQPTCWRPTIFPTGGLDFQSAQ